MDFYSYDVSSNSWTQITDYGPGNREKATAFVVNDIAYVGSGYYLSIKSIGGNWILLRS
jgi:N-acetylneuraminic acid mutarotase